MKSYREEWKEANPDKHIVVERFIANAGHYCHAAYCTWSPNCTVEDLVDYVDNSTGNYGGRVEHVQENSDGTESGKVVVYFD